MNSRDGRVLRILGGSYRVELDDPADQVECTLRGRLKQGDEDPLAVGDRVEVELLEDGDCRVAERFSRRSRLARRRPTGRGDQTIVANVDQLAAVCSIDDPQPDRQLLDRLLVMAELNRLDAFLVANKTDLFQGDGSADSSDRSARELLSEYAEAGYEVIPTSTRTGRNLELLDARLSGRSTVLTGASGVGKSALANALIPGLDRRVGEVGRKGRHTTVSAAMLRYDQEGYVADTPGLQYLALWRVEPADLSAAFPEFRPYLGACRFSDCRHLQEPGCPVLEAVDEGELPRRRYDSYRKLLEEAEEEERW